MIIFLIIKKFVNVKIYNHIKDIKESLIIDNNINYITNLLEWINRKIKNSL